MKYIRHLKSTLNISVSEEMNFCFLGDSYLEFFKYSKTGMKGRLLNLLFLAIILVMIFSNLNFMF